MIFAMSQLFVLPAETTAGAKKATNQLLKLPKT